MYKSSYNSTIEIVQFIKWDKGFNRYLYKEFIEMDNKHKARFSPLVIRDM